jgi:TRAP-type C4-dicarboxylate transport system substrate-binding protein
MNIERRTVLKAGMGLLTLAPTIVRAQAALKLPLATMLPEGNFHTINVRRFALEVKKATGGAVDIDVQSGGHLGFKAAEQMRAVRDGLVPMADILDIEQAGDAPMMGVEAIPFLAGSIEEWTVLQKHIAPEYRRIALKNNQTILYTVPWPAQYLHLKVKAEAVDALKAIKIRVPDSNAQDMCNAIGMAAAVIPWSETILTLSSGAVSGVSTSAVSGVDGKVWEFLKFFHATSHTWSSQIVTINNDTWKKIAPTNQRAIVELAQKLEPEFWMSSSQADSDSARRLSEAGMQRVEVPAPMMAELRKRTAAMTTDFYRRVPMSEKPIRAYLAEMNRA